MLLYTADKLSTRDPLLATFLFIASTGLCNAKQSTTITAQDVDSVFNSLGAMDWKTVEELSDELVQRDSPAQRNLIARLRYIYIFSIAKQIENKAISYEDIKRRLEIVEGKLVVQPWHPINTETRTCFNQICVSSDRPHTLYTAQTDSKGTLVYSFEYFDIGRPIDISSYNGQNARLGGILESVDVNQNIHNAEKASSGVSWFLKLNIKDSFIHFVR